MQAPQRRCVEVAVAVCRYATQPGDTLVGLSRAFHRSSNWRRLWNANAGLAAFDPQVRAWVRFRPQGGAVRARACVAARTDAEEADPRS